MWSHPHGTRLCQSRRRGARARARAGFSLIEILVVVSILLVISAIEIPNMMQTIAQVRLRSAANSLAGLLQQGRIRAVRDNKYYRVFGYTVDGTVQTADTNIACVDIDNNATCSTTATALITNKSNPQIRLGGSNVLTTSTPPTSVATAAGISASNYNVIEQDKNLQVYFNSRGLPCAVTGSGGNAVCNSSGSGKGYAYIYYITDGHPIDGWAAVTVSPSGRVRVWMYQGNGVWNQ
jgi:prepilin-type N-terminal cleavage/methylation domain-containing protein